MSGHAGDLGGAEGVEAVHQGDTDVDFGGLAVSTGTEVSANVGIENSLAGG
jgi:hypothetical protein